MTGPWEWGLEKMRLKRPCRSFLKGVTLLDLDGKEVASCSGPSDSLCVFFKVWLLGARTASIFVGLFHIWLTFITVPSSRSQFSVFSGVPAC